MSITPSNRPRITTEELTEMAFSQGYVLENIREVYPLLVVGKRGYYVNSMGKPGVNDRGMYDDAILLLSPNGLMSYNGNVDPSAYRKGKGIGKSKGMASLKSGLWAAYRFDLHKGEYLALCQRADEVTVMRDGDPPYEDTGWFGINIHRGGVHGTSSEGCQTIPPAQWPSFIETAEAEAKRLWGTRWKKETVAYLLLD